MNTYKKGLENVPLRQFDNDPYPIMIIIRDLNIDPEIGDDVVQQLELDYSKFDDRKHLGRLTHWAIRNKHSIETLALKDANGE